MHLIDTYIGDWCKHPHNDGQKVFVFGGTNEVRCLLTQVEAIGQKPCNGCAYKTIEERKEHSPQRSVALRINLNERVYFELADGRTDSLQLWKFCHEYGPTMSYPTMSPVVKPWIEIGLRKPPLGVMPKAMVREKRMAELARAIHEYVEGGHATRRAAKIYEWAAELARLSETQSASVDRKPTP